MFVSTLQAQKNGYTGPTLGPRESKHNPRNFDEDVMHAGNTWSFTMSPTTYCTGR